MTSDDRTRTAPPPAALPGDSTRTAADPWATVTVSGLPSPLTEPVADWPPALTRYRPLHALGRGGMGVVYLCHDEQLDRQVAVKFPRRPVAGTADGVLAEARAAARLHHPNICPVFDADVCDGVPYLTMGFVHGPTLAAELKRLGPCPPRYAAKLVRAVAEAMRYAHDQGVIHRDLKPGNILLTADHEPVITDFGLAVRTDRDGVADGAVSGTPAYMAPEQAAGDAAAITERTDVFALGVILFETLCGRVPFDGSARQVLEKVRREAVPPVRRFRRDVPSELARVVATATARAPTDRFADMAAFADALGEFLRPRPEPTPKTKPRGWGFWLLGGLAVLLVLPVLACGTGLLLPLMQRLTGRPASPPTDAETVESLLDAGRRLEGEGRDEAALLKYTRAVELDPDHLPARERRGELALRLEKLDTAVEDFTVLRRARPNRADYDSGWGMAVFWREVTTDQPDAVRIAAALDAAELAVHHDPAHARGYQLRADVFIERKEYAEAEANAGKAIELEPNDPVHWRSRAHARSLQGKEAESLADADHAAELERRPPPPPTPRQREVETSFTAPTVKRK